jgi:hypothetical protein
MTNLEGRRWIPKEGTISSPRPNRSLADHDLLQQIYHLQTDLRLSSAPTHAREYIIRSDESGRFPTLDRQFCRPNDTTNQLRAATARHEATRRGRCRA